jgi:hypothetical protein
MLAGRRWHRPGSFREGVPPSAVEDRSRGDANPASPAPPAAQSPGGGFSASACANLTFLYEGNRRPHGPT